MKHEHVPRPLQLDTLALHATAGAPAGSAPVAPPIVLSTTFERNPDGSPPSGHYYSRAGNPNRDAYERCLAALEGATDAAAFSSGLAATIALLQTLSPGDHVVFPQEVYFGTANAVREVAVPWGIQATFCDTTDPDAIRSELRPSTRLIWIETPSNPMLSVTDIAASAVVAREVGALLVCDNTWPTPILTRPLEHGADFVVHSSSKYIGGHGDVIGGIVAVGPTLHAQEAFRRLRTLQTAGGAVPSPFDCWLLHRGLKTLAVRVRAQSDSALRVANFLVAHPGVSAVLYPGLEDAPGHEAAARQMSAFGGMFSFQVRVGRDASLAVASRLRLFTHATSLGSVESLIEHRASIEGPGTSTPDTLLRVSVGLESADDLLEDLIQALDGL